MTDKQTRFQTFPRGVPTLPPLPSLQAPMWVIKLDPAKPKRSTTAITTESSVPE